MDKYEFSIKVEQIRKLVNKNDYETAMKIADTIDWRKVRNANLLSMVAQVYEKNNEYQEAKDILLLAFERAPIGKRLLYKLTDLALKEGNTDEAEAYYREFCDMAGDDSRQYLLRYKILKAKDAPVEQLIHSLESYTAEELDEKWLYELAELYHMAGHSERCVQTCDKIMLMFGLGKYVDKAMELKIQHAPLTSYQMDLVENREKYEAKLRAVEQAFSDEGSFDSENEAEESNETEVPDETEELVESEVPNEIEMPDDEEEKPVKIVMDDEPIKPVAAYEDVYEKEELEATVKEAEAEERLAREMSRLADDVQPETEFDKGKTKVFPIIKRSEEKKESVPDLKAEVVEQTAEEEPEEPVFEELEEEPELPKMTNHLMIEARTPEKGLAVAVQALKKIQAETGIKNPVAKITGSKLNKKGILASADKLAGKDLVIEEAGDLSPVMLKELDQLMMQDTSGMRIILIDNPKQMGMLHAQNLSLASRFECIGSGEYAVLEEPAVQSASVQETKTVDTPVQEEKIAGKKAEPVDDRPVRRITPVLDHVTRTPSEADRFADEYRKSEEPHSEDEEEEMDIDAFAQYACEYAAEIDCSITGKSMLAMYERIEIMEEDGIPLTKENAEELIEEAADRAEKPSFFRRIKGLFSSKYDKDGLLILREEHFI
ncbi:MAG: tetratricopeptide repeat protein [Brotaphodocola sp.]